MTRANCVVLFVMILMLCITAPVDAEEWGGGFGVGVISMDMGNINSTLKRHGTAELSDWRFCPITGAYYKVKERLTLGFSGFFNGAETVESDSLKVKEKYTTGLFEVGYLFPVSESFSVRPLLGVGNTSYSLKFTPRLSAVTFDELLDNPGRTSKVSVDGRLTMVGLGAGYAIPLGGECRAIRMEFKARYMCSPQRAKWKLEDGAGLFGAPKFRPGGLYLSLSFSSGKRIGKGK